MSYFDQLKSQASSEIRSFVKENESDELFQELLNNPEFLKFILSHKALTEKLMLDFCKKTQDFKIFVESLVQENMIPSPVVIESALELGESVELDILKILKKFPSIVIEKKTALIFINLNLLLLLRHVLVMHPKFQKKEFIKPLIGTELGEDIEKIILESKELFNYIVYLIFDNKEFEPLNKNIKNQMVDKNEALDKIKFLKMLNLRSVFLAKILAKLDDDFLKQAFALKYNTESVVIDNSSIFGFINSLDLEAEQIKFLIDKVDFDRAVEKWYIPYRKEFEKEIEIPYLYDYIFLKNVPKDSKFRKFFLLNDPETGEISELLNIFNNTGYRSENIYLVTVRLLKVLSLEELNGLDFKRVESAISPADLRDDVLKRGDENRNLFLFDKFSSKYNKVFRDVLPEDKALQVKKNNQKKFFHEILESIKTSNIDDFNLYTSKGYSLEQFSSDSYQESKKNMCENSRVSEEFSLLLSPEQLLTLSDSHVRMRIDVEKYSQIHKFSIDECVKLSRKVSWHSLFRLADNKTEFILHKKTSEENELKYIVGENFKEIVKNSKVFESLLKKMKTFSLEVSINNESFMELAQHLDKDNLKKIARPENGFYFDGIIFLKDKNNDFVFDLEDIKNSLCRGQIELLEDTSFLRQLIKRFPEFAEKIILSYLKGNKELSKVLGEKVAIRRSKVVEITALSQGFPFNFEQKAVDVLNNGVDDLRELTKSYVDVFTEINNLDLDKKTLKIKYAEASDVFDLALKLDKKINIEILNLDGLFGEKLDKVPSNISIKNILIDFNEELSQWYNKDNPYLFFEEVKQNLDKIGANLSFKNIDSISFDVVIEILSQKSITLPEEVHLQLFEIFNLSLENEKYLKYDQLSKIDGAGIPLTEKIVKKVFDNYFVDLDAIYLLHERVGDLSQYSLTFGQLSIVSNLEEEIKKLKEIGVLVYTDNEKFLLDTKKQLKNQGFKNEELNIEQLSIDEKIDLISFIESEIDFEYKKLELLKTNLDTLDKLLPTSLMRTIDSFTDEELVRIFFIPNGLKTNKKFMKGLRDFLILDGASFVSKAKLTNEIITLFDSKAQSDVSMFLDYSNLDNVLANEFFDKISFEILDVLIDNLEFVKYILVGRDKSSILRFLRSASEEDGQYLNDIFNMIKTIKSAIEKHKDRLNSEISEQEKKDLYSLVGVLETKLVEFGEIDHAKKLHDNLVGLTSLIKTNALEVLGQDKFIEFEKSKEMADLIGYKLFFPKTRGEVQLLGAKHGWCVSSNSSYADGVISNGNILVGFCPKDGKSGIEEVIALAHFKNNSGYFSLEQIRWSIKITGEKNIDAKSKFDHKLIINEISKYLFNK